MKQKFKEIKKKILAEEKGEIEKEAIEKEEVEIPNLPGEFKTIISKGIDQTFKVIAKRKGEEWNLQPDELEALSNSYSALAEKYLPTVSNRFATEISAIFWTAVIIFKRII